MGGCNQVRLAIIVSHPIQHFAPWHQELAKHNEVEFKVFFCRNWGSEVYQDSGFGVSFKWDVPLLEGYDHEFLPAAGRTHTFGLLGLDNPEIESRLDRFCPDVVKIFGYTLRTNWRAAKWAKRNRKPVLLYSDSNIRATAPIWKKISKQLVVRRFYDHFVDGALFVGDNNRDYHAYYGLPHPRLFRGIIPVDRKRLLTCLPDPKAARAAIRSKYQIPESAFVLLFCGKYVERKRPLDLVRAAHALKIRGLPVWALLVGEGSARLQLESWIRTNGTSNVTLTGFVNQSSLAQYYAAADALVVPSASDPHPLVVTEAACFRLPIVASDKLGCIGPMDTARPGANALIYPCGRIEGLASCVEQLWKDHRLYSAMAAASERIASEQDASAAATHLAWAVHALHHMGPR